MNDIIDIHQDILKAYKKRESKGAADFFAYRNEAHMCRVQERHLETLRLLLKHRFHPLTDLKILDVGGGDGNMLRQFMQWGASPENLSGVELRSQPVEYANHLNPNIDFRCGSAIELPWADKSFDLVCQHTVFTSMPDSKMKRQAASEMSRVLRKGGAISWYDFLYSNPQNPDVKGVNDAEIHTLFPGFKIHLKRITLAPPIARRLPNLFLPVLYNLLASIPFLRTHYLGLFVKV